MLWLGSMEVTPTIVAIREKADAIRKAELAENTSLTWTTCLIEEKQGH